MKFLFKNGDKSNMIRSIVTIEFFCHTIYSLNNKLSNVMSNVARQHNEQRLQRSINSKMV